MEARNMALMFMDAHNIELPITLTKGQGFTLDDMKAVADEFLELMYELEKMSLEKEDYLYYGNQQLVQTFCYVGDETYRREERPLIMTVRIPYKKESYVFGFRFYLTDVLFPYGVHVRLGTYTASRADYFTKKDILTALQNAIANGYSVGRDHVQKKSVHFTIEDAYAFIRDELANFFLKLEDIVCTNS